jgi:dipeptidyl aminopeptidase/acylaminoacyl peptidase
VEGLGFEPQWSPTGKKLLYSVYNANSDYKPELWIVNSYGDQIGSDRKTVKLNTWADKCSFGDDNTLFCAVPKDLPEGAGMSREVANESYDDLYKVDLKTGLKTPLNLNGDYNITNISYDPAKNKVIFTDLNKTGVFEAKL